MHLKMVLIGLGSALASIALTGALAVRRAPPRAALTAEEEAYMTHLLIDTMARHRELSALSIGTPEDTVQARRVYYEVRDALRPFAETTAAVAAGYRMVPRLQHQHIYHFTNPWRARLELLRFDPARPSSLLYQRHDGRLRLVGAMFTAPRGASSDALDRRVPTSIARWHRHIAWCERAEGQSMQLIPERDGHPVFGPNSPIATKTDCDAVGGVFSPVLFQWMLHVYTTRGDDLSAIWAVDEVGMSGQSHHD